jgi:hypothetical protein
LRRGPEVAPGQEAAAASAAATAGADAAALAAGALATVGGARTAAAAAFAAFAAGEHAFPPFSGVAARGPRERELLGPSVGRILGARRGGAVGTELWLRHPVLPAALAAAIVGEAEGVLGVVEVAADAAYEGAGAKGAALGVEELAWVYGPAACAVPASLSGPHCEDGPGPQPAQGVSSSRTSQ